jgi:hypothetical protein
MSFSLSGMLDSVVKMAAPMVMDAIMPGSSELLGAANNLLGGAIGDVAKGIIDQVGKEMGAPKSAVDGAVQDNSQPTSSDATDCVQDKAGSIIDKFKQTMMNDFNDIFADYKKDFEQQCGHGGKGGKGGTSGTSGGGDSFLVVLAKLLGALENKQFDKVVQAGKDVSAALGTDGNTNSNNNGQFDKMEALKGQSSTLAALTNSVSTSLQSILDAAKTATQPR